MRAVYFIKLLGYVATIVVFIFGFSLFYKDTQEWIGSLTAAILSAGLTFLSFLMLQWLVQVFTKKP